MSKSKIEWTDRVWNPVTGCNPISPGCDNCYAERMSKRFAETWGLPADGPFKVTLHPERLKDPMRWKKPERVFVCSMADLFHKEVPFDFISEVFFYMELVGNLTFLVLTKRPERMKQFFEWAQLDRILPNLWLGVTAENQEQADKRIPILLQIPAAVRFASVEPMLGPVNLQRIEPEGRNDVIIHALSGEYAVPFTVLKDRPKLDWVICGGESGPGARPMHPDWPRSLRDQCQVAGAPFFFKQWGEFCSISQMPGETYRVWDCEHGTECCWKEDDPIWRVGKKKSGSLLDGQEWKQYPKIEAGA